MCVCVRMCAHLCTCVCVHKSCVSTRVCAFACVLTGRMCVRVCARVCAWTFACVRATRMPLPRSVFSHFSLDRTSRCTLEILPMAGLVGGFDCGPPLTPAGHSQRHGRGAESRTTASPEAHSSRRWPIRTIRSTGSSIAQPRPSRSPTSS